MRSDNMVAAGESTGEALDSRRVEGRLASRVEQGSEFFKFGIGGRASESRRAIGARQRRAVDFEDVRHPAQRVQVDVAEQRPHVRRLADSRAQQGRQIIAGNRD